MSTQAYRIDETTCSRSPCPVVSYSCTYFVEIVANRWRIKIPTKRQVMVVPRTEGTRTNPFACLGMHPQVIHHRPRQQLQRTTSLKPSARVEQLYVPPQSRILMKAEMQPDEETLKFHIAQYIWHKIHCKLLNYFRPHGILTILGWGALLVQITLTENCYARAYTM